MEQWHRQQGESAPAYEARWKYIQMGSGRSLAAVAQELSKSDTLIKRWSSNWRWVESAEAYDRHMVALEQRTLEDEQQRLAEEKAAEWSRRFEDLREREWKTVDAILKRLDTMLKFPVERQEVVTEGGKKITIIEPVKWTAADMGKLLLAASRIGRQATGADGDRDVDFDILTDEQVDRLARTGKL
jgi:hypothetical protein